MKQKTQEYVQFIKENHKDFEGKLNGKQCADEMGISQGRISQLISEIRGAPARGHVDEGPVSQEAAASTAEA